MLGITKRRPACSSKFLDILTFNQRKADVNIQTGKQDKEELSNILYYLRVLALIDGSIDASPNRPGHCNHDFRLSGDAVSFVVLILCSHILVAAIPHFHRLFVRGVRPPSQYMGGGYPEHVALGDEFPILWCHEAAEEYGDLEESWFKGM